MNLPELCTLLSLVAPIPWEQDKFMMTFDEKDQWVSIVEPNYTQGTFRIDSEGVVILSSPPQRVVAQVVEDGDKADRVQLILKSLEYVREECKTGTPTIVLEGTTRFRRE